MELIKNFLKWWVTDSNGHEYMTFFHCAMGDVPIVVIISILSLVICLLYGKIYYEVYKQSKIFPDSLTKKYLKAKMNVFLFCALSGYGYTLISVFFNPYKLKALLLVILAFWSWKFIKSIKRQSSIVRIMEGEKALQEKLIELKALSDTVEKKLDKSVDTENKIVKYEELEQLKFNNWTEFGGLKYKFIEKGSNTLVFETEMKDGSQFDMHYHDCIETVYVKKGTLICPNVNKSVRKGENITFEAYEKHKPKASGDVCLIVIFQKPQL